MPLTESQSRYVNFYTDYEESLKNFRDWYSCLATAENKGRAEANIQNAQKMKQKGFSAEDISDITGLTIEEIENL